jgi:ssDNA-binding Zn-finger/Zn-ribbon topoisomerase 1
MLYRINKEKIICENCGYTLGKQYPDDYIYHGLEMNPSLNKFIET